MDDRSFQHFESLRQAYFPPHRNQVPAHISLFHHLPGEEFPGIAAELARVSQDYPPFPVRISGLRFAGRGVAYLLESERASELHGRLSQAWKEWLIPQDRQRFAPHITVQNKADPAQVRALYDELQRSFLPISITAIGVDLWRYLNGPWEPVRTFNFRQ